MGRKSEGVVGKERRGRIEIGRIRKIRRRGGRIRKIKGERKS